MPTSPPRPCRGSGCRNLTKSRTGRCPDCERAFEQRRGTARSRGYDAEHERMRARVLCEEPLCRICGRNASIIADHIKPLRSARDAKELAQLRQRPNYQGVCQPCHDRKRATEDKQWPRAAITRGRARATS